jgi:hypothetical protein
MAAASRAPDEAERPIDQVPVPPHGRWNWAFHMSESPGRQIELLERA